MRFIVANITSILQHLLTLQQNPEEYCPKQCVYCGWAILWGHGCYERSPIRGHHEEPQEISNPITIPRFLCPQCQKTQSSLPEALPPRRWYLWAIQSIVLWLYAAGKSIRQTSLASGAARSTCKRWLQRFMDVFLQQTHVLRAHWPDLGLNTEFSSFWPACLKHITLAKAMLLCHQNGAPIS